MGQQSLDASLPVCSLVYRTFPAPVQTYYSGKKIPLRILLLVDNILGHPRAWVEIEVDVLSMSTMDPVKSVWH